jgi:hypothetical protein
LQHCNDRLLSETLVTLKDVSRRYPSSRRGRSVHLNTIRRWVFKGILGVKLCTVMVGGTVYTSEQEIERWQQAVRRKRAAQRPRPTWDTSSISGKERARRDKIHAWLRGEKATPH